MVRMNKKKNLSLMSIFLAIAIVASSMVYMMKEVKVDYSKTLPQKRVPKGPGYHRKPIIDFKDRTLVHLGDFTTNTVADNKAKKFLKTKISVRTSDEDVSEELQVRNIIVRDAVIEVMSSNTFEEIASPQGKEKLKENLTRGINKIVTEGEIEEVYFTEFIVQ